MDGHLLGQAKGSAPMPMKENAGQIPIGKTVLIEDKSQLLFSKEEGGRLALVQMVDSQ